ncbi:hydrolase of the HD superfamily [Pyrobaculum islandicum DSM 4184]|uniref:Hydrolase of the HD superfamily n=1 Tax=Pyrobaculum islandicum (strain DSM 4184 / JCM 9189 / GEO3) TaxID=384616 RepID=A1RUR4_PYRIL|nr:HD superfamily hydrolase [Pyrobaculum islandicum]ABL88696.1 hydrolase of the HD superfamily [Pyrobaculum islandicum DSM 4184]
MPDLKKVLGALLHDVGKPIRRAGLADRDKLLENIKEIEKSQNIELRNLHDTASKIGKRSVAHTEFTQLILNLLLPPEEASRIKPEKDCTKKADRKAAMERVGSGDVMDELKKQLQESGFKYGETTPMLLPQWMLLKTKYLNSVGLCSSQKSWNYEMGRKEFIENLKDIFEILKDLNKSNKDKFLEKYKELLCYLFDKEIWVPVKPLDPEFIINLRGMTYKEALNGSDYPEVARRLISMLVWAGNVYNRRVSYGLINTVLNILKATTMFVPSAHWAALVPDISLYSHSRLTAAFSTVCEMRDSFIMLTIDTMGVQRFVASPREPAAASRILRGRSLIVILALDALTKYALHLFEVPKTNVLVEKGGAVDLILPVRRMEDDNSKKKRRRKDSISKEDRERLNTLEEVAAKLSDFLGSDIRFIVAYTKPRGLNHITYLKAWLSFYGAMEGGKTRGRRTYGIMSVLTELERELAKKKAVLRRSESWWKKVGGYDSLTKEAILDGDKFSVKVGEEDSDYFDGVAGPGKLQVGDVLAGVTHMSLAAGSAGRGLAGVIGIHLFGSASEDDVESFVKKLSSKLFGNCRHTCLHGYVDEFEVAVVPLLPVRSVYLLLSVRNSPVYDVRDPKQLAAAYRGIAKLLDELTQLLRENGNPATDGRRGWGTYIDIKIVNAPHAFILTKAEDVDVKNAFEELSAKIRDLLGSADVEIGFDFFAYYHPAVYNAERGRYELVTIDEYEIIGLAKMDVDRFGDVRLMYAFSPSRLVTLSDYVNMVLMGKGYLTVVDEVKRRNENAKRFRLLDVIPLYAGGDDLSLYGKWSHLLYYLAKLHRSLRAALYPLTLSLSAAIDRDHVPLLYLYRRAVEGLELHAKRYRAAGAIESDVVALEPPECGGAQVDLKNLYSAWNFQIFEKVLDPFTMPYVKLEEWTRELYILSSLAARYETLEIKQHRAPATRLRERSLQLKVYYAYVCVRRKDELEKLIDTMKRLGIGEDPILLYPSSRELDKALKLLSVAKPYLDLVLLAIRRKDTVQPLETETP